MERKQTLKVVADDKIPFLKGRLEKVAEVIYAAPDQFTPALVKDADILLIRTRTKCDEALLKGSAVKLIATATIGTDHIDLDWCRENGIAVENAAGCNAPGVAQYVWSSLIRNGFDPSVHTLGVVGCGNVGSIVADWGRKLGCRMMVCDPPRKKMGYQDHEYLPLEEILREADAVTLHTPLTRCGADPTFHLVGDEEFSRMREGAILINAARGEVVDNKAWKSYLKEGRGVAVIDTWEWEPELDRELLDLAEIATPHIAGYSLEGKQRATRMALEAIERNFHVELDKSGLEGNYHAPEKITAERICGSYNPYDDTLMLKSDPSGFEKLRGSYNYRPEP